MASKILDRIQIAAGFVPVNLATAANNGDWVCIANYGRIAIVVFKDAGSSSEDPVVTVQQASAIAGTGAKALNFTTYWIKTGADLTTIGLFTQVSQASGNTCTIEGSEQTICVIEFAASDLDVANSFDCVRVTIADVGSTSQIGAAFYLLADPSTYQRVLPSAITD